MKKFFKLLIALIVIAGIAVGIYFIFGNKQNNAEIYANVNNLEQNEIVEKVNSTLNVMLLDINANSYDIPEIKTYFTIYVDMLDNFDLVKDQVLTNGAFINNNDNGDNFKSMNDAYKSLLDIYQSSNNYLVKTYDQIKSKVYIENFYNLFKDSLKQLNKFYYNVGTCFINAIDNSLETNNLYRLKLESYLILCNQYVEGYLKDGTIIDSAKTAFNSQKQDVENVDFDLYISNKTAIDQLVKLSRAKKITINEKFVSGEIDTYIFEVENETEKQKYTNYYNMVLLG